MMVWARIIAGTAAAALLTFSFPALAANLTLSGEVTYRERIALPVGATLKVRLLDLTAAGRPTRVEAQAGIGSAGQAPLTFTLNFDDRVIDPSHEHGIVAEISSGLELWFRNTEPHPVKTAAPDEKIVVTVAFTGRLTPSVTAVEDAIVPIVDLNWRALAIRGRAVTAEAEPSLSITSDMRAGGKGGCNNYFAQAAVGPDTVVFSAIASTKMACASAAVTEQETAFFDALAAARRWRMNGDDLVMLDAGGTEVLRFGLTPR